MARKRATPNRGDGSPNRVLVVFLVLFILATFGLGGWAYSMMNEQHKATDTLRRAEVKEKSAKKVEEWLRFQILEFRAMVGDAVLQDDKSSDYEQWKISRAEVVDPADPTKFVEGGKFTGEGYDKDREALKKSIEEARKELDWNAAAHKYNTNYLAQVSRYKKEMNDARTLRAGAEVEKNTAQQDERSLNKNSEKARTAAMKAIADGNAETLAAAKAKTEEMTKAFKDVQEYRDKLTELNEKYGKDVGIRDARIKEQQAKLDEGFGGDKGKAQPASTAEPHALALDISKGKPLWDAPRAKIIRIDERDRKVTIDKGSKDGIRPQLTFNVFGAGWNGKAEGAFKGTVEVIRVEPRTSVARITSVYDWQGNEVSLNDPSPSKILRESNNVWKDGDLLFNLAWGARVAIAGVIDWSGQDKQAPAAQMEEMDEFLSVLKSQGVTVDAYVDLRDGQLRGALRARTAYLVVGQPVTVGAKDAGAERGKAVNAASAELRKQALERGMFLISPENFANVIGFRRHRSKTDTELYTFHPGMPSGGPSLDGGTVGEGGKGGVPLSDLAGKWTGKLTGGGQLVLNFKGDGVGWQLLVEADNVPGHSVVGRSGDGFAALVQGRRVTFRLVGAALQVNGQGIQGTLNRE